MIFSECSDIIFALYKITKSIIKLSIYISGFPIDVENMGELKSIHGRSMGEGGWRSLKYCRKILVMEFI